MSTNRTGDSGWADDAGRSDLGRYHREGWEAQEKNPELSYQIFTRGRDEARRLDEPWWVLHYEGLRLAALTSYVMDFTRALPLAAEIAARFSSPEGQAHPSRLSVLNEILYTYLNTDPIGCREDIEKGLGHLDSETPRGPESRRFILFHRWRAYLIAAEDWEAAHELALRSLALLSRLPDGSDRRWHTAWVLDQHCQTCHALGKKEELAAHADHLIEVSVKHNALLRTEAAGAIWRAVGRRERGDERGASESFHRGMALLEDVERRDSVCGDGRAAYFEAGGDFQSAVGVRDREIAEISRKGMLHRSCQLQVERCRLLVRAGELTAADLEAARLAAGRMRVPEWYLERLGRIDPSGADDAGRP